MTAMGARGLGAAEVAGILGVEVDIVEAVAGGDELAAEDLARGM